MLLPVARFDDLAPGMRRRVHLPNTMRTVMVMIESDGMFAIANSCPHHGSSFDGGGMTDRHLICPWHFWRVDFRTGSCLHNPTVKAPTYPVVVRDGMVFVEMTDAEVTALTAGSL